MTYIPKDEYMSKHLLDCPVLDAAKGGQRLTHQEGCQTCIDMRKTMYGIAPACEIRRRRRVALQEETVKRRYETMMQHKSGKRHGPQAKEEQNGSSKS